MTDANLDFANLKALFINTTLTRSPGNSHTQRLVDVSASIMAKQGVAVDQFRSVDHPIATGIYPDMREHGWADDAWPDLFGRVRAADILVIAGPIWLGDNSSETKKIVERLYAHSGELNDKGQWLYYCKVGGCLITGNEDGIKHCASNVLYSLPPHWLLSGTPVGRWMDR
jgi:multimeric flavodoxin WrbA